MRPSFKSLRVTFALLAAGLTLPACSGGQAETGSVEILDWWNQGGEAEAIHALLAEFTRQYPSIGIVDGSVPGGSYEARAVIASRMSESNPPNTFQANGGWGLMEWVLYDSDNARLSKMAPIDDIAADWKGRVPDPVLASVSYGEMPGEEHIYAVPLNTHRLNTLFYNKALFAEIGIDPANLNELSDLFAAAEQIKMFSTPERPIAPIALGYGEKQEWTLALVFFENLLVGRKLAGSEPGALYSQLFGAPKTFDVFSPDITYAMEDLRRLLSYTNEDADELAWDKAMNRVLKGEAAMTIMGDWAKGYADAKPEYRDAFGFIPMPGTADTFVFTTDTFGLPINPNPDKVADTKKLLGVFGSARGQEIFNQHKGSISARLDVEILADDDRKPTFDAFRDPKKLKIAATSILAQQTYVDAVSGALANFAKNWRTATASEVQHTMDNYRDLLVKSCWPACRE
jgi:glucose/mannose transport system substrate-binding protein